MNSSNSKQKGLALEKEVAKLFRAAGARVDEDIELSGCQVDVFVEQDMLQGGSCRTVVECKNRTRKVERSEATKFANEFTSIRFNRETDKGLMVAAYGFTPKAKTALSSAGAQHSTLDSLRNRLTRQSIKIDGRADDVEKLLEVMSAFCRRHSLPFAFTVTDTPCDQERDD